MREADIREERVGVVPASGTRLQEIEFVVRDGTLVRADVYLPEGDGPFPVVFGASPYQKALAWLPGNSWQFPFRETGPIDLYVERGYAYVWADVPGTGRSEGKWNAFSRREGEAMHDLIEHVAGLPWSNGRVGMIGQSYFCMTQWNVARTRPPHLVTIAPYDGATDVYRDWSYHGGIPNLGFAPYWVSTVLLQHQAEGHDVYGGDRYRYPVDVFAHPFDDEWQRDRGAFWELDGVDIPVLSIGCWGKSALHLRGNTEGFKRVRGPKQLLLVDTPTFPSAHALFNSREFHEEELLPWYDHHLKGADNGVMDRPAVRYFVNRGRTVRVAGSWPPADVRSASFYLSAERSGVVSSLNDGSLLVGGPPEDEASSTSWTYPDPQWVAAPVTFKDGVPDRTSRLVTYTSGPFERTREFSGDGVLVLHASTDQREIDVYAKLSVLPADGPPPPLRVTQGWLRASHRAEDPDLTEEMRPFHTHREPEDVEPGVAYELRVELQPMSFLVRPGERLRLEISNADSPLSEGGMVFHWYGFKVGTDTYHHDAAHPSRLILPERPRSAATSGGSA